MSRRRSVFVRVFPSAAFAGLAVGAVWTLGGLSGIEARADPALAAAPSRTTSDAGESVDPPVDDSASEVAKEDRRGDEREDEELDRLEDGDIDEEDRVAIHARGVGTGDSTDVHDESWISLVGLRRELQSGKSDLGGMVIVGLALDRLAAGPVRRVDAPAYASSARTRLLAAASLAASHVAANGAERGGGSGTVGGDFPPWLARECVAAALRTAGLDGDARLDSIVSRAHASAALPETRLRAMRLWDDANHTTTLATTDGTNYYDAVGANLVLEARLTWRLDRLVYAGDEPTLERLRLERQEARSRLSTRTLEALFAWERARVDAGAAVPDTRERIEADLRAAEARATLDVLTGGRFSDWERSP
jgi:hypothetical protein